MVLPSISPKVRAVLPKPDLGWFDVTYAALSDGSLGILRASHDVNAAIRRVNEWRRNPDHEPRPERLFPVGTLAELTAFDGAAPANSGPRFNLESAHPLFDRSQDQWIVVDARCRASDKNALVLAAQGKIVRRFHVGDGVEHVMCDRVGGIWVGYFDEGVFTSDGGSPGRFGWVRFNGTGAVEWSFNADALRLPFIHDCYAMNVSAECAWVCCYSDWNVMRAGQDGHLSNWNNEVAGARALAVEGDHLVLAGGYDERDRVGVLLRFEDGRVTRLQEFSIDRIQAGLRWLPLAAGRGDTLHFVSGDQWLQLTVSDVRSALGL